MFFLDTKAHNRVLTFPSVIGVQEIDDTDDNDDDDDDGNESNPYDFDVNFESPDGKS